MLNIFKKKETVDRCIFCGKSAKDSLNELKYEAIADDGTLQEYVFGKVCNDCSDILDKNDEFVEMVDGDEED